MTAVAASGNVEPKPAPITGSRSRRRLFRKYVVLFTVVISTALVASGLLEVWFSYREQMDSLARLQREQARAASGKVGDFIGAIQSQLGWTTQLPWSPDSIEQRRFDALRLLRQVPAITEFRQVDPTGHEQLHVSRLALDIVGSQDDYSQNPLFTEAVAQQTYFGPIYFRRESEPYLTMAQAGTRREGGVAIAEVNLKFIWDLVREIRVGERGYAYVVDGMGRLIAHPDISLVLRNTNLAALPQVQSALRSSTDGDLIKSGPDGTEVITANAPIPALGWHVFVEMPLQEALAPIYGSALRTGALLLLGLAIAFSAGVFLARRMVVPIRALQAGAAQIGSGDLSRRLDLRTGDELEALAAEFNEMAERLQQSHSDLERRVDERTRELARSVAELKALGEVSQAISASFDLQTVLTNIVTRAVKLSDTDAGGIHQFDEARQEFMLTATYGTTPELAQQINGLHIGPGETALGEATSQRRPVQIPDLSVAAPSPVGRLLEAGGFRALLAIPLLHGERTVGGLVVRRKKPGGFPAATIDLLQTFAAHSVIAIQNAQLFGELSEKTAQLELTSQHKSQFLANMSHELRTPLNAILGYTELLLDHVYGPLPEKAREVLDRVQFNGKHLLALINNVLDLSKIEAGQLTLSHAEYDLTLIVRSAVSATESLAKAKGLELRYRVADGLPTGRGDDRRLIQVLLNLIGNAIKFTEKGFVEIDADCIDGEFVISVRDTGLGIAQDHQRIIFLEFQQVDSSITRAKGGTGLGLAISKRIVEMHGGNMRVDSTPGAGATFRVMIPVLADQKAVAA